MINEEYDIMHISERAGRYLQISGGEPSQNLLKLIRPELRLELRSALYQATQRQIAVDVMGLKLSGEESKETINIHVRPVWREGDIAKGFILVVFEPVATEEISPAIIYSSDEPVARHLEEELMRMKLQLRNSNEQHEFQAEELKASNEELQAMNEELRSAAEELETSKEELQSINEELITVNQELKVKVEEVSMVSNNLQNLINSTDIGTIFLDRSFRVVLFTPSARNIFNLIPADYGRQLSDITNKLTYTELNTDVETVLARLQTVEREVQTNDQKIYLMRISPYRTTEDRIQGVVVSFINITERKEAEETASKLDQRFQELLSTMDEAFVIKEMITDEQGKAIDFRFIDFNNAFMRQTGLPDPTGKTVSELIPGIEPEWLDIYSEVIRTGQSARFEKRIAAVDQWLDVFASRVGNAEDKRIALLFTNITERVRTQAALQESELRQSYLLKLGDVLRSLTDPKDIRAAAMRVLGEQLQADRVLYFDVDDAHNRVEIPDNYVNGVPGLTGHIKLSDFGHSSQKLIGGQMVNIPDVDAAADISANERRLLKEIGVSAMLAVPLTRRGRWASTLVVHHFSPREWTERDILFLSETAERTWDAAERAASENALRESEAQLRITMESATDYAIINTNTRGVIESWSAGAERIFGYAEAEAKGQPAHIIFTPEDIAAGAPEEEMRKAREEGRAEDERWHIRKDGRRFYMSGVMRPIMNPTLVGYVKVARDMTAQQRAAEELRISEERYRIALQSGEMGAWDWNIANDTVVWNEQHFIMLGIHPDDEERNAGFFIRFVHPDDKQIVADALQEAIERTGVYFTTFRIIRADNEEIRWVTGYGRVIEHQDNKAVRMIGVMYDITDQKKLEEQKDAFIGIASHELKTPVTSIKAYTEVLREIFTEAGDVENTTLMTKLDQQVDRLIGLIHTLLDTTSVKEGHLVLQKENIVLDDLITETVEIIQRSFPGHHIETSLHAPDSIVFADRERIRQVLVNLITNGVKYSPVSAKVVVSSSVGDDQVTVGVLDSGMGIPEEMQEHIFDRFYRGTDPTIRTFPGLGLGLYITAEIIRVHGGKIWVSSAKDKGSLFCFSLQLARHRDNEK